MKIKSSEKTEAQTKLQELSYLIKEFTELVDPNRMNTLNKLKERAIDFSKHSNESDFIEKCNLTIKDLNKLLAAFKKAKIVALIQLIQYSDQAQDLQNKICSFIENKEEDKDYSLKNLQDACNIDKTIIKIIRLIHSQMPEETKNLQVAALEALKDRKGILLAAKNTAWELKRQQNKRKEGNSKPNIIIESINDLNTLQKLQKKIKSLIKNHKNVQSILKEHELSKDNTNKPLFVKMLEASGIKSKQKNYEIKQNLKSVLEELKNRESKLFKPSKDELEFKRNKESWKVKMRKSTVEKETKVSFADKAPIQSVEEETKDTIKQTTTFAGQHDRHEASRKEMLECYERGGYKV